MTKEQAIKIIKMNPKKINIGDQLHHNQYGEIEVLGISPHCGDYKIITFFGWVYLKNCKKLD